MKKKLPILDAFHTFLKTYIFVGSIAKRSRRGLFAVAQQVRARPLNLKIVNKNFLDMKFEPRMAQAWPLSIRRACENRRRTAEIYYFSF